MKPLLLVLTVIFTPIDRVSGFTPAAQPKLLRNANVGHKPSVSSALVGQKIPRFRRGMEVRAGLGGDYICDAGTSTFLNLAEAVYDGPADVLAHSATFWSVSVMLSIVGLLVSWEEAVKTVKKTLPKAIMPVVDSMLAEMGGIGFIGLFLSIFVTGGALGQIVGDLSERFLGEEEILLETFEFLHTAFFEVGIGFFVVSGIIVLAVLTRVQNLSEISELALDTDGDGEVSLDELADALQVESLVVDADGDGFISEEEITDALRSSQKTGILAELFMSDAERGAEALVVRERVLERNQLDDSFLIESYFEQIFAHNLEEIVELSPLTWLPLIPLIALDNSVDLSHEVISAASSNAAETAGFFYATPWFFYPSVSFQVVGLAWGLVNFWKMANIKSMLLPTLVRDGGEDGPAVLLPPRYEDKQLRADFESSPSIIGIIEQNFGKPPRNEHERLFGKAGANGPELYRNSLKFHTWLCVAQIVFFGGQIVIRDAYALYSHVEVGNPPGVFPELAVYGVFVLLSMAQLALAPTTFLNYCVVSSVEELTKGWAIEIAKKADGCEIIDTNQQGFNGQAVSGQQVTVP